MPLHNFLKYWELSFTNYLQDWIGAQIVNCSTPVHPVMTDLLNAYAASCFNVSAVNSANRPLSEEFMMVSSKWNDDDI